jgi:hypothetical protein
METVASIDKKGIAAPSETIGATIGADDKRAAKETVRKLIVYRKFYSCMPAD